MKSVGVVRNSRLAFGSEQWDPVTEIPEAPLPHSASKAGETVWPPYCNGGGAGVSGCGGTTRGDGRMTVVDSHTSDVSGQTGSVHGQVDGSLGPSGGRGHQNGRHP